MTCRNCGGDRLEPVFQMEPMPLAGGFAETSAEAITMRRYPLTWLLCRDCALINVEPAILGQEIYARYSYSASTVPALVRHHARFADVLMLRYGAGTRFLEVGGNDGVLLDRLPSEWARYNIDPSDVSAKAAQGADWQLVRWDDVPSGSMDVVSSSNALAHFTGIGQALDEIERVLTPDGEAWIEVHDLDATLASGQWDTIYHEHCAEWSCDALVNAMAARGFDTLEAWSLTLHGGLLRMHFRKAPVVTVHAPVDRDFEPLRRSYAERRPPALAPHSAAYGAAARGVVYLNQIGTLPVDYMVDASPLRAGKFVPGLGIPVLPPEVFEDDRPETCLITAWNHAPDIVARHPTYDGWVTAW